jgi:hypothetical protein
VNRALPSACLLPLALFLAGCDKPEPSGEGATSTVREKPARVERRESRDEEEPDPKVVLRDAFQAANSESDAAAREKALETVAWDGIDVDPELAREAFAALEPGGAAAKRLVGHFAMRLADEDPEAALAWAKDLEQSAEREEAIGRIAVVISAAEPARGATLVAEQLPPGTPRDRVVVQVVQRWSQDAPEEAADWLATFPQGAARSAGMNATIATWMAADAAGFAAWAAGKTDEDLRKEAAAAAADALRAVPDDATRETRLGAIRDEAFRAAVEELLEGASH